MKSNKLFNVAGSKERLFEMMQKVNKVKINEDYVNQSSGDIKSLEQLFNGLSTGMVRVKRTNTQTSGAETFLEVICFSQQGSDIVFRFKIEASEGDQDGVMSVNDAELVSLTSDNVNITEGSTDLQQFNAQHKPEIIDIVSEYADIDTQQAELDEEYINAVEKIESYPFTSEPRTMVTSRQYGDEKPTNPALRVKSPLLDKFVDEAKRKKKAGEYPDQIGSHFKPKSDYPVEKKKPQTAVSIDEEIGDDRISDAVSGENLSIGDVVTVDGLFGEYQVGVRHSEGKPFLMPFDMVTKKANPAHRIYLTTLSNPKLTKVLGYSETSGGFMSESIENIEGGLGDDKLPQEFDQEQVLMGLGVEMEHSDDPTVALEIVLDHLTEDPEYYTTKEDPEASAQANAAEDAGEKMGGNTEMGMSHAMDTTTGGESGPFGEPDDKEEEDILLGFKPHNVGDDLDEVYGQPDPLKIPMLPKDNKIR